MEGRNINNMIDGMEKHLQHNWQIVDIFTTWFTEFNFTNTNTAITVVKLCEGGNGLCKDSISNNDWDITVKVHSSPLTCVTYLYQYVSVEECWNQYYKSLAKKCPIIQYSRFFSWPNCQSLLYVLLTVLHAWTFLEFIKNSNGVYVLS